MSLFAMPYTPYGINGIVAWLSGWEDLHKMLFNIDALSEEVQNSYTLEVMFSFLVPVPNYLWWMSNAGVTISWVVLLSVVFHLLPFCVFVIQIDPKANIMIFCFKRFCIVSFGLTPKKNPILTFLYSFNFHLKECEILAKRFNDTICEVVSWFIFDLR